MGELDVMLVFIQNSRFQDSICNLMYRLADANILHIKQELFYYL